MHQIGILSTRDDIHALLVKKKIEERGERCHLLLGKELALAGGLSWSNDPAAPSVLRDSEGNLVELCDLDAFWYRRAHRLQDLPVETDPEYEEAIHASSWIALQGLLLNEFQGAWVSHPAATELAENKLLQLLAAREIGLRAPATLVSQDPARIRAFCAAHPGAILKPLRSRGALAITAVVGPELLAEDEVLALSPSIYQECIAGDRHLRVTMFGPHCFAAQIEATQLDWRTDVSVPFTPYQLAPALHADLARLLGRLGLVMGIFDLKITPAGEIVFLEVNAQGQFLFVEGLCDLPIADALADYLVDQARASRARRRDGQPAAA
jgi:hypothetical protein